MADLEDYEALEYSVAEDSETEQEFSLSDGADVSFASFSSDQADELISAIASKPSVRNIRSLLSVLRVSAVSDDTDAVPTVAIPAHIIDELSQFAFGEIPTALAKLAGLKPNVPAVKAPHWSRVEPLARAYAGLLTSLLAQASEEEATATLLAACALAAPILIPQPRRLSRLVQRCQDALASGHMDLVLPAHSFLRACVEAPGVPTSTRSAIFRAEYLAYVTCARSVTPLAQKRLALVRDCVIDLYATDLSGLGYETAFGFVRQLATFMRGALHGRVTNIGNARRRAKSTKSSGPSALLTWRFVNGLRCWAALVCAHPTEPTMLQILYPVSELLTGFLRVVPASIALAPARLNVCAILCALAERTGALIPTAPALLETLAALAGAAESQETAKSVRGRRLARDALVDLSCVLRVPKAVAAGRNYRDTVVVDSLHLILEYAAAHAYSAALPEHLVPIVRELRALGKIFGASKASFAAPYSQACTQTAKKLEAGASWLKAQRESLTVSPADLEAVGAWERALAAKGESPLAVALEAARAERASEHRTFTATPDEFQRPRRGRDAAEEELSDSESESVLVSDDGELDEDDSGSEDEEELSDVAPTPKRRRVTFTADAGDDAIVPLDL
jgi:nucleolar complex protein 2